MFHPPPPATPPHQCEPIPDFVIENIKELVKRRPVIGYDIGEIGRVYFSEFKTCLYPEKYGLTWLTLLQSKELEQHCEVFNSGLSVRLKNTVHAAPVPHLAPPTPRAGPSNLVNKMESVSASTSQASSKRTNQSGDESSPKRTPMDTESCSQSADSYATGATRVSISPQNQSKLDRERSKIHWIPRESGLVPLTFSTLILEREMEPDQPPMYIDTTYCDRRALEQLMDTKGYIKSASAERFAAVRNRFNEFEFERGAIFHHGAAIKMANIDALMDYALSSPKAPNGSSLLGPNELLYFADIHGGPGGYAEYFLWKKKWHAKGFGISPRGKFDYNLLQAEHYPVESFETFYGENGIEGTGDINKPYNIAKFSSFVRESTGGRGVHFVIASAGDRNDYVDEDQKEVRCKYVFMSELLCALQVLRQGGHYVCRIYDSYLPFTVGLIYLMYRCFEQVAIFKPESSLPASSERYIICKWRRPEFHTREVVNYLSDCHRLDWHTKRNRQRRNAEDPVDIVHLIFRDRMKEAHSFTEYIYHTNTELSRRQFQETKFLLARMKNGDEDRYVDQRLLEIQQKCHEQWQIPRTCRQKPKYAKASTADLRAMKLIVPYSFTFYRDVELRGEVELVLDNFREEVTQAKEWSFMSVGRMRGFFLCLGGTKIYQFGGAKWTEVNEKIELMNNTLVYADLVDEIKVNGANQAITTGFHIIDALILGGNDIRSLPTDERYDLIIMYAQSMNKSSRPDLAKIRMKPHYDLKYFGKYMAKVTESERIRSREGDGTSKFLAPVSLHHDEGEVYCPDGIVFMKLIREKFAPADALYCLSNRLLWRWSHDTDIKLPDSSNSNGDVVMLDEEDEDKKEVPNARSILSHLETLRM